MTTHRKLVQRLFMLAAFSTAATIVAATLRGRPSIRMPERVAGPYQAVGFQDALVVANSQLAEMARVKDLDVAPTAENLDIARRLSLALVGSGLSLEEVRAFNAIDSDRQIQWLTSYLLEDQRWADYFAERFSRAFVGTNDGPFLLFRRRKFNAWLSEKFASGESYDSVVRQMISAEGLWTDTPQVNFITATMDEGKKGRADPIRLAGRTSRAFLAQRIDCLQCHDDFVGQMDFGEDEQFIAGEQEHFHSLAAFFAGTALPDFAIRGIREDGDVYKFEFLGELEEKAVEPGVPFAKSILDETGKPRQRLAKWITHPENLAFSRATVNRVWALMFSRPLVSPVDNIPLDDSVPPVLDTLAEDFSSHGFNLRRLIRLITETDAFRRSSRAEFAVSQEHEDAWALFPITQLRPEQVVGSVFQACKLVAIDSTSSIFTRLKVFGESQDFLKRFGDRGEDEFDSESVTITQRLLMMNGNLVTEQTKVDLVNNAATRIAVLVSDDVSAVELVFLSALNRYPSATESEKFVSYLAEKNGNSRSRALGDIYWAIINSTEFSWNH